MSIGIVPNRLDKARVLLSLWVNPGYPGAIQDETISATYALTDLLPASVDCTKPLTLNGPVWAAGSCPCGAAPSTITFTPILDTLMSSPCNCYCYATGTSTPWAFSIVFAGFTGRYAPYNGTYAAVPIEPTQYNGMNIGQYNQCIWQVPPGTPLAGTQVIFGSGGEGARTIGGGWTLSGFYFPDPQSNFQVFGVNPMTEIPSAFSDNSGTVTIQGLYPGICTGCGALSGWPFNTTMMAGQLYATPINVQGPAGCGATGTTFSFTWIDAAKAWIGNGPLCGLNLFAQMQCESNQLGNAWLLTGFMGGVPFTSPSRPGGGDNFLGQPPTNLIFTIPLTNGVSCQLQVTQ